MAWHSYRARSPYSKHLPWYATMLNCFANWMFGRGFLTDAELNRRQTHEIKEQGRELRAAVAQEIRENRRRPKPLRLRSSLTCVVQCYECGRQFKRQTYSTS